MQPGAGGGVRGAEGVGHGKKICRYEDEKGMGEQENIRKHSRLKIEDDANRQKQNVRMLKSFT
jgi:hypothetical protein